MHNEQSNNLVNGNQQAVQSDLLWGAAEIGKAIGRNARQTFHLLSNEQIQCAKKVGGHWVCSRAALLRELGA